MTRAALLLLAAALSGCLRVQMPTADEIDDATGQIDPPMRPNAQTCGATLWIQESAWTPIQDSATCPDGFPAEQVGYSVSPVDGSCEKGMLTLHNYRARWGCIKWKVNYVDWDHWN